MIFGKKVRFFGLERIDDKTEFVLVFHPTAMRMGLAIDIFARKGVKPRITKRLQNEFDYQIEDCPVVKFFLEMYPDFEYIASGDLCHIPPFNFGILDTLFRLIKNNRCAWIYAE